jgi:hypothetical protein
MSQLLCAKESSDQIISNSELLIAAIQETKGSGRLKFILRSFLELNNILLKNNNRYEPLGHRKLFSSSFCNSTTGAVAGFSISSWKKFSQVKLNSGETAQNYVLNKLVLHVPEAVGISSDMPSAEEAKNVNLNRMSVELKKLDECITAVQEFLDDEKSKQTTTGGVEPTKAFTNLTKYHQELVKYVEDAKKLLTVAIKDFTEVCQYFGENSPPMEPEGFFTEIISLLRTVQTVVTTSQTKSRRKAVVT